MTTAQTVTGAKASAGPDAYLWLHDSGDCILWPDEASSENDNGSRAVGRWQLAPDDCRELIATGEVNEQA
jgi:hypothetical protein